MVMQDFKKRLYNYEADPPQEIWDNIDAALPGSAAKVVAITSLRKRSKILFYSITATASLVIIFLTTVLFNKSEHSKAGALIIMNQSKVILSKKIQDSISLNSKILKEIIKTSKDKNLLAQNYESSLLKEKKYLTITGPGGQPVKISPKVATLIESADNESPPKPVWNKKIDKWQQIMLTTTLSPTSTNLLDIVQISSSSEDNNE
jgi:hypothetical protein